jgi:hypothetical protein
MSTSDLKLPRVGEYVRHSGKLVAIEDVTPPQPPKEIDYIFEEITAKIEVLYNNDVLKSYGEFNDFYGLENSVSSAIEGAKQYAGEKQITKDSELEVRVTKIITQYRKRPMNKANFYSEEYIDFQIKRYGSQYNLPEPIETIVWSSKDKTG